MEKKVNLYSPWAILYRKYEAFFKEDPNVKLDLDNDKKIIKLYVTGSEKAEALAQNLPAQVKYGNETVEIKVIPANLTETSKIDQFRKIFEGNEAVTYIGNGSGPISSYYNYIAFEPEVVQYPADDLSDLNGQQSTLYQNLAKEIFGDQPGIYFCTATK